MANSILNLSLDQIARALGGEVHGYGAEQYIMAPAPGHSRKDRSLSIRIGPNHPDGFLVNSFAGDDDLRNKDYVRERLSLPEFKPKKRQRTKPASPNPVSSPARNPNGKTADEVVAAILKGNTKESAKEEMRFVEAYDYTDASGAMKYQILRYEPKTFRQRHPDGNGGWTWNLNGVERLPYCLDEIIKFSDAAIIIVEGEKDANRLRDLKICATTGAKGTWQDIAKHFQGRDVAILPDFDRPGTERALEVATALNGVAKTVKVIMLPGLDGTKNNKDVSDWLRNSGNDEKKLAYLCIDAPLWTPGATVEEFAAAELAQENETGTVTGRPLILSSAEFVKDFVPPDYVIHGIAQRGFLYSFTGKTGAGKTAVMLLIAAHVALGNKLGDRDVEQGRVLYLAGENADDVRMRWIAYGQQMGFDLDTIPVNFIPGVFKISEMRERIRTELQTIGDVSLIIVDTSAAYFEGDDENDNKQFGDYARLILRPLTNLPGNPCVIAACHSVKNAADNNLSPRGGGAFVNEMDGNLTSLKSESGIVEMHWQIKFRGPEFSTIYFSLRTVTHERLKDTKGGLIPTVTASFLTDQGRTDMLKVERSREDELLILFLDPTACKESQRDLAKRLGWLMKDLKPHQVQVSRVLKTLGKAKLITVERGEIHLTKKGEETAKKVASGAVSKQGAKT